MKIPKTIEEFKALKDEEKHELGSMVGGIVATRPQELEKTLGITLQDIEAALAADNEPIKGEKGEKGSMLGTRALLNSETGEKNPVPEKGDKVVPQPFQALLSKEDGGERVVRSGSQFKRLFSDRREVG